MLVDWERSFSYTTTWERVSSGDLWGRCNLARQHNRVRQCVGSSPVPEDEVNEPMLVRGTRIAIVQVDKYPGEQLGEKSRK